MLCSALTLKLTSSWKDGAFSNFYSMRVRIIWKQISMKKRHSPNQTPNQCHNHCVQNSISRWVFLRTKRLSNKQANIRFYVNTLRGAISFYPYVMLRFTLSPYFLMPTTFGHIVDEWTTHKQCLKYIHSLVQKMSLNFPHQVIYSDIIVTIQFIR